MGWFAAALVRLYQVSIGRAFAGRCRFHPSCSNYAIEAFRTNGLLKGGVQATWRLLRCGPWAAGGVEPVRRLGPGPVRRCLDRLAGLAGRAARAQVKHG